MFALGVERAGDVSGGGIHFQSLGQAVDGELHGPLAGGGNGVEQRRARPDAEDRRAVDPRLVRRRRREDLAGFGRLHAPQRHAPSRTFHKPIRTS